MPFTLGVDTVWRADNAADFIDAGGESDAHLGKYVMDKIFDLSHRASHAWRTRFGIIDLRQ